jgi:hypothetical protein
VDLALDVTGEAASAGSAIEPGEDLGVGKSTVSDDGDALDTGSGLEQGTVSRAPGSGGVAGSNVANLASNDGIDGSGPATIDAGFAALRRRVRGQRRGCLRVGAGGGFGWCGFRAGLLLGWMLGGPASGFAAGLLELNEANPSTFKGVIGTQTDGASREVDLDLVERVGVDEIEAGVLVDGPNPGPDDIAANGNVGQIPEMDLDGVGIDKAGAGTELVDDINAVEFGKVVAEQLEDKADAALRVGQNVEVGRGFNAVNIEHEPTSWGLFEVLFATEGVLALASGGTGDIPERGFPGVGAQSPQKANETVGVLNFDRSMGDFKGSARAFLGVFGGPGPLPSLETPDL